MALPRQLIKLTTWFHRLFWSILNRTVDLIHQLFLLIPSISKFLLKSISLYRFVQNLIFVFILFYFFSWFLCFRTIMAPSHSDVNSVCYLHPSDHPGMVNNGRTQRKWEKENRLSSFFWSLLPASLYSQEETKPWTHVVHFIHQNKILLLPDNSPAETEACPRWINSNSPWVVTQEREEQPNFSRHVK